MKRRRTDSIMLNNSQTKPHRVWTPKCQVDRWALSNTATTWDSPRQSKDTHRDSLPMVSKDRDLDREGRVCHPYIPRGKWWGRPLVRHREKDRSSRQEQRIVMYQVEPRLSWNQHKVAVGEEAYHRITAGTPEREVMTLDQGTCSQPIIQIRKVLCPHTLSKQKCRLLTLRSNKIILRWHMISGIVSKTLLNLHLRKS